MPIKRLSKLFGRRKCPVSFFREKDLKQKIKTAVAFALLGAAMLIGFVFVGLDNAADVYPKKETQIMLYGESHGFKEYYDIELDLWKKNYDAGCRNLFVELPFYTADFLNFWMKENSDELIDEIFVEIKGTLSGNEYYNEFFHGIKERCPETVFYGTDVGHQFGTTGERYLKYLEEKGLSGSEKYSLAKECIQQGKDFYSDETRNDGMSPVRESYMTSNFIEAYSRCGGGKIMGIYGSYHTDLKKSALMTGRLREHYGDIISSVRIMSIYSKERPYKLGFCVSGLVFLLMLFVPNVIWAKKKKPEAYDAASKKENKILLVLERIGEAGVSCVLLIFTDFNPCIKSVPGGFVFDMRIIFWVLSFVLMILYELYWIKYFRSPGTMADFYSSFAGFPVAGASLPVISALILGIYSGNLIMIFLSIILGIGHIGIHLGHRANCR